MRSVSARRLGLALVAVLSLISLPAAAQGVTTAAMNGTVVDEAGTGLPGATVVAVHEPSGTRFGVATRSDGRFNLRNLRVGGPYSLTVSYVGFETERREAITLELSQDLRVDVTLREVAAALGEAVVRGESGAILSSSNTGTGTTVSNEQIQALPTISRSLTDFTRLTPQFSQVGSGSEAGSSVGGSSSRFNNIQVDGAALNDAFGLESSGTPGGSSGTQPISLDAVEEFRVAIAPYDVRQGNFTGGNINVITRAGTNRYEGSGYLLGRNQSLVGADTSGADYGDFSEYTAGLRLGGPIQRDKLFFFGSFETVQSNTPVFASFAGDPTPSGQVVAVPRADVQEILDILGTQYGRDAGTLGTFEGGDTSYKFFGRLDYNLSPSNKLTARFNYVEGQRDDGIARNSSRTYQLEDRYYTRQNTNTSSVVELRSLFGQSMANLFRASLQTNRQPSVPQFAPFPSFEINNLGAANNVTVQGGPDQFRSANNIDADVFELTNNFDYFTGDHVLTVGTQNTLSSFENLFIRNITGFYRFDSIEDFRNGAASQFERNYSAIAGEDRPVAAFGFGNVSLYAQDEWTVSDALKVTGGLRADLAHYFDRPAPAAGFSAITWPVDGGRTFDNSEVPNGHVVFQPRVGFNYDVGARNQTQVRGGVGVFNGNNPAVWISNAFTNDGSLLNGVFVRSRDDIDPTTPGTQPRGPIAFRPDAAAQYTAEDFGLSQGSAEINLTDPDFRTPTVLRTNLAVDHQLPYGLVGTLEGLYTNVIYGMQWQELNRTPFERNPATVDGRGQSRQSVTNDFQSVILLTNTNEGHTYNVTGQLQKPAGQGLLPNLFGTLSYTYGRAFDINSVTSSQARSNVRDLTVGLDVNDPPLATSNFELRHRVLGSVSYRFDYARRFGTTVTLLYDGQSGAPFSYVYLQGGDPNSDRFDRADLIFVPASRDQVELVPSGSSDTRTPDEIWAQLDAYIAANPDLDRQRGQIFERNSTRAPWVDFLDLRIAQDIETVRGQKVQLTLDVQNVLNLLSSDWGLVRTVGDRFGLLGFNGYTADGRQQISFSDPGEVADVADFASRWRMQLGVRYTF